MKNEEAGTICIRHSSTLFSFLPPHFCILHSAFCIPHTMDTPAWQPPAIPSAPEPAAPAGEYDAWAGAAALLHAMQRHLGTVFLGQPAVINQVLVAFIAGGHVLLEGKPGLGKTHLV